MVILAITAKAKLCKQNSWHVENDSRLRATNLKNDDIDIILAVLNRKDFSFTFLGSKLPASILNPVPPEKLTISLYIRWNDHFIFDPRQMYISVNDKRIPVSLVGSHSAKDCVYKLKDPLDVCVAYDTYSDSSLHLRHSKSKKRTDTWSEEGFYLKFDIPTLSTDQQFTLHFDGLQKNGIDIPPVDVLFSQDVGKFGY